MNDSGSSPEVESSLVPAKKAKYTSRDSFETKRRQEAIAQLRYIHRKTQGEIVEELAKLDPPIHCTIPTVSRDLQYIGKNVRRTLSAKGFDAADAVMKTLAGYEYRERMCMAEIGNTTKKPKPGEISRLVMAANHCAQLSSRLLQDVGLLDRKLGTLFIDDGKKAERIPSGTELQKLYDSIDVVEAELVSEAELAWKYGDQAAAESAANAAVDSSRDQPDGAADGE
jgi:hypothetical protein